MCVASPSARTSSARFSIGNGSGCSAGKPEVFGTTKAFLDYFGLKRLDDLPPLAELQDIEGLNAQLEFATGEESEAVPANVTALRAGEAGDGPKAGGGDDAEPIAEDAEVAEDAEIGESAYVEMDETADADEAAETEASAESEEAGEEERASAGAPPSS